MYKYEMHLHSKRCSACGVSSARDMVAAAMEAGYAGVVFTNHFFHGNTAVDRSLSWRDFVNEYKEDYLDAKAYGDEIDIDVLFGIEEVYEPGKEALIYGISPDTIASNPAFNSMNIAEMSEFVRSNGGFIACAHPFRNRDYIPDPDREPDMRHFDAVEVHNYFNTDEDNEKARLFAERDSLQVISGGDIHHMRDVGHSGLAFENRIHDGKELVKALKEQKYRLIIKDEII